MKNAKRILVALALVLIMAVTAVIGLADDATTTDYTDILKYYDPLYSSLLIDEDFEGEGFVGDTVCNANDTIANKIKVAGDEENKYLVMTAGGIANSAAIGDMLYYYNFDEASDLFLFDFSLYADHTAGTHVKCTGTCKQSNVYYDTEAPEATVCSECGGELVVKESSAPTVELFLDSNVHGDDSKAGVSFVVFNFETGIVEYYAASTYIKLGVDLKEKTWYDVNFVFTRNTFTVTVTDTVDADNSATSDVVGTPSVFDTASIKIGYTGASDNRDTEVRIDDVYLQLGDSYRNVTAEERLVITRDALANMKDLLSFDAVPVSTKVDIIRVYDELCTKYDLREVIKDDADAVAYADAIVGSSLEVYTGMLKEGTDAIDKSLAYSDRLLHIEAYQAYADKVAEYITETTPEEFTSVYNAYLEEKADLASDEVASIAFIEAYNKIVGEGRDFFNTDYTVTKGIYDEIRATFFVDGAYTYNATYPGVQTASNAFAVCRDRYEGSMKQTEAFIAAVESISVATTDKEKLGAYALAVSCKFENTTYPGVADAIAVLDSYVDLKAIGDYAEEFLSKIEQAAAALNLASKSELLDAVEDMLDLVNEDYPGVIEAKAAYEDLRQSIEDSIAAAQAYIAAVNALANLEGDALREGIANALILKEKGNIIEIDGVVEANITLDTAKSNIDLIDSYAAKFIRLVDMIDANATLAERFAAIRLAKEAEAHADDSVSGVSAAKLELAGIIVQYNNDVNGVNSAFASVNNSASSFAGSASAAEGIFQKTFDFIKAIFA